MNEGKITSTASSRRHPQPILALPDGIQDYFNHFEKLLEQFPYDVLISYLFAQVELAHNQTIYCGIVKLHKTDSEITRSAIESTHMTRESFQKLFKTVFDEPLPDDVASKILKAAKVRDHILHGKRVTQEDKRKAVVDILEYSELFNNAVDKSGKFKPFGELRGFKGAGKSLDKSTTRWVLRGIGLNA